MRTVTSIRFSPDDTYFVSGSQDETIRLWNTSTRALLFRANVSYFVSSVVFLPSSDDKNIRFVSASTDGLIRIWNVDVGFEERIWNTPGSDGWLIIKMIEIYYLGFPQIFVLLSLAAHVLAFSILGFQRR